MASCVEKSRPCENIVFYFWSVDIEANSGAGNGVPEGSSTGSFCRIRGCLLLGSKGWRISSASNQWWKEGDKLSVSMKQGFCSADMSHVPHLLKQGGRERKQVGLHQSFFGLDSMCKVSRIT
jgi:hypothetical protein